MKFILFLNFLGLIFDVYLNGKNLNRNVCCSKSTDYVRQWRD